MNLPQNKSEAHAILHELWGERPEAVAGALIVDFLSRHTDAKHISFAQLFDIAVSKKKGIGKNDVLNIINYFTGRDLNLLMTKFEYIEGETVQSLEIDQVRAAESRKINPLTGDEDAEVGSKIFVFFVPSELAKKALVE